MSTIITRSLSSFFKNGFQAEKKASSRVQKVYDILYKMKNIEQSILQPSSSTDIISCMEAMNNLSLDDIGIDVNIVRSLKYSACMNVCTTPLFDIAIFLIPAGNQLPIHDHPNMTVLSKLLIGQLSTRSFTPLSPIQLNSKIEATMISGIKSSEDPTWLLSPTENNIHEFIALSTCVVFDVLMPPYTFPERPCTYYKADQQNENTNIWDLTPASEPKTGLPYNVPYTGVKPKMHW
jgi:cysteamine dioxygenase